MVRRRKNKPRVIISRANFVGLGRRYRILCEDPHIFAAPMETLEESRKVFLEECKRLGFPSEKSDYEFFEETGYGRFRRQRKIEDWHEQPFQEPRSS